jgi:hypothetical protein
MGELYSLLPLGVWLPASLALVGIGVAVLATPHSDRAKFAQFCFILAALVVAVKLFLWGCIMPTSFFPRFALCFVLFGLLGASTVEAVRFAAGTHPARPVQQESSQAQLGPNIICLGEDDLFLELANGIFRESRHYDRALRAVTGQFQNRPRPPQAIVPARRVITQITYYHLYYPDVVEHTVHHPCWLNERSPDPPFEAGAVHQLIIGTFEQRADGGFEREFTIWEHDPAANAPPSPYVFGGCHGFRIKVALSAGEHSEFGGEYDYELRIDLQHPTNSYTFEYLSEARKEEKRNQAIRRFQELIAEGQQFLQQHIQRVPDNWTQFYGNERSWRGRVEAAIRDSIGMEAVYRFDNTRELRHLARPENTAGGIGEFLDQFYTRLLNLQDITGEYREHGDLSESGPTADQPPSMPPGSTASRPS